MILYEFFHLHILKYLVQETTQGSIAHESTHKYGSLLYTLNIQLLLMRSFEFSLTMVYEAKIHITRSLHRIALVRNFIKFKDLQLGETSP